MKIYHGTNAAFDAFKMTSYDDCTHEYYGEALYFSSNYETASNYGSRVIEIELPEALIDINIDGDGRGMKQIENLKQIIAANSVIAISNVFDSNLAGAQCKSFPLNEDDCGKYRFPHSYHIGFPKAEEGFSKSKAEHIVEQLAALGIKSMASKSLWPNRIYKISLLCDLTIDQARHLNDDLGIPICKSMGVAPEVATTVVFAGQKGLDILNKL